MTLRLVSVMSHNVTWRNPFGMLRGSCRVAEFSLNTIGNPFGESWLFAIDSLSTLSTLSNLVNSQWW